jgi:hypothetical protein
MSTMGEIFDTVQAFFEAAEWPTQPVPGETMIGAVFEGRHGHYQCVAVALEDDERFVFYCMAPEPAAEDRRGEVAEFLHRANDGLTLGCFEVDWDDGTVRFRASIDVQGDVLSQALCRNVVFSACFTMDDYLPGLEDVLHRRRSAAEAVRQVEGRN